MNIIELFEKQKQQKTDINEHLDTIKEYASKANHITEFGVRTGVSTTGWLAGKPKKLISYDIQDFPSENFYKAISEKEGIEFTFNKKNVLNIEIEETDILFIDTWHTYEQLSKELEIHASKAKKHIIFHDTETFGYKGEDRKEPGLVQAINEFLEDNDIWGIEKHKTNNNGLTILTRDPGKIFPRNLTKIKENHTDGEDISIRVVIPYHEGNLAKAYNDTMKTAKPNEWILFLDHDAMILRPEWHKMCIGAIKHLQRENIKAGWISAVTNEIWCEDQLAAGAPDTTNIKDHIKFSDAMFDKWNALLRPATVTANKFLGNVFSGVFILTNREAWEAAEGFEEEDKEVTHNYNGINLTFRCNKFLGVDNDYFLKTVNAGYKAFTMPGLYVYHLRTKKDLFKKRNFMPETQEPVHEQEQEKKKIILYDKNTATGKKLSKKKKQNNSTSISACIMGRAIYHTDDDLHTCLKSIKPFVDEIIFVNTRIKEDPPDNYSEIAESYGAKVYHHPWEGSFSKGRNQSISHCTKDWLLFIDVDEELIGDPTKLKKYLKKLPDGVNAINIKLVNIKDGRDAANFRPPKIFRKGNIQYQNIVHNQPIYDGFPSDHVQNLPKCNMVYFKHYGYEGDEQIKKRKFERTSSLLHKRLEIDPKAYECYFYLSQIYGQHHKLDEQIEYAEEYLKHRYEMKPGIIFDVSIYFSTVHAYLYKNDLQNAVRWLQIGLKEMPDDIDLNLAAVEVGIKLNNQAMIVQSANKYIKAHHDFPNIQHKLRHFIHGYTPEALIFCEYNLAAQYLQSGRNYLEDLYARLPVTKPEFQKKYTDLIGKTLGSLGLTLERNTQEKKVVNF